MDNLDRSILLFNVISHLTVKVAGMISTNVHGLPPSRGYRDRQADPRSDIGKCILNKTTYCHFNLAEMTKRTQTVCSNEIEDDDVFEAVQLSSMPSNAHDLRRPMRP